MKKAGVIGYPIEHSLSPVIHNFWLRKFNMDGVYERVLVRPEELSEYIDLLRQKGFAGFNVTIPHKEMILPMLDEVSEQAEAIGAVNTVTFKGQRTFGENTDKFGFWFSLQSGGLEDFAEGGRAVVIGAGGAARSVVANLLNKDEVIIVNRTRGRAEKIKSDFESIFHTDVIEVADWEDLSEQMKGANLLVNSTSLGMKKQPQLEIDIGALSKEALVYDVVYNPLETELLKAAKRRGNMVQGGLDMLIGQAMPGFTEWFGKNPGTISPELKEELLAALEKR